jgi:cytochrome c biogenesis protein CcdA
MDLETVSKLVVAHSSPEALKLEKARCKRASQERMYQSFKFGLSMFILGMAGIFITKTLGFPKSYNLIGGSLLFLAMGLMIHGLLAAMRESASRSRKLPTSALTSELPETEITKELPAARVPVPVPSVTERTTQLITAEKTGAPRE